ncbi:MAG: flavodoxin-like fold-containing protein [Rhodospirillales bacterium]|nr:flavodoxin-like fold-containing protein [Rhodospirillales bacterium]
MRILVIFAHPVAESFNGALFRLTVETLGRCHDVRAIDLNADGFDPRMSREERLNYHEAGEERGELNPYIAQLRWAEAVIFCFPVWSYGVPAILKGFFDRTMGPDIAFTLQDGTVRPKLTNIRLVGAVTTYGQSRWAVRWLGDLPRAQITRFFTWFCGRGTRTLYLAQYNMNVSTARSRERFLKRVERRLGRL